MDSARTEDDGNERGCWKRRRGVQEDRWGGDRQGLGLYPGVLMPVRLSRAVYVC